MSRKSLVVNFLNEVNSNSTSTAIENLKMLIEDLENKNDPDSIEIEIVDLSYQLLEKFELLKTTLRRYSKSEQTLSSDRLINLYSDNSYGSSKLFND